MSDPHNEATPARATSVEYQRAAFRYPPFVRTAGEKERWDLARGVAIMVCGADGEPTKNPDSEDVWQWTRIFYRSDMPTTPEPAQPQC